eukprot:gb/GECH01004573.1/.p1 GENE.gb/GECH01004573.1/~~gb/GECH01004573.1/.p1  ORF type:complete len:354 (+),score=83.17 gb/GECH01004573.1/:1-1062(+)
MGLLNSGPSGFSNAPVSKACVIITLAGTVAGSLLSRRSDLNAFAFSGLFKNQWQLWRIFTGPCVFTSLGEMLFGILLLYVFRVFERQWGSHRYAVLVFISTSLTFIFTLCTRLIFGSTFEMSSGPYGLIFAALAQYFADIPATNKQPLFGVPLSEKAFVYMMSIQLLFLKFPGSLIAGSFGFLSGILFRANTLRLKHIRFPRFIVSTAKRLLGPLLHSSNPVHRRPFGGAVPGTPGARNNFQTVDETGQGRADTLLGNEHDRMFQQIARLRRQQAQGPEQPSTSTTNLDGSSTANTGNETNENENETHGMSVQASEENIQQLEQMGFNRDRARQALEQNNNNVPAALNILLDS